MVHIKVGAEEQDFCIHKDLIYHYSPYFKAAFNTGLQEAKTGIMKLPETDIEVFELFQGWLYTQCLLERGANKEDWPKTNDLMKIHLKDSPNYFSECAEYFECLLTL
jgi:BTB/POZ domain